MATESSKSLGQQYSVPGQQTNARTSEHWTQPIEAEQCRLTCKEVISCPLPEGVTVYASGTNRATDIHGAMVAGVPIGVDVSKLSARAIEAIEKASLPVLLDSGAFSLWLIAFVIRRYTASRRLHCVSQTQNTILSLALPWWLPIEWGVRI
jgi:hypothetical protein